MKLLVFLLQLTLIISLDSPVCAQTKPPVTTIPDEVMKAEFVPVSDSTTIKLRTDKGNVTVVLLWATWCAPCRLAISALNEAEKDLKTRGVNVVALTTENPARDLQQVNAFLGESEVDLSVAWLGAADGKILMGDRDVLPQILVLTADGTVTKRFVGWHKDHVMSLLREAIEQALTKAPPK